MLLIGGLLMGVAAWKVVPRLLANQDVGRATPTADIVESYFRLLRETRQQRRSEIVAYFEQAHRTAESIAHDPVMRKAFFAPRGQATATADPLGNPELDEHYVSYYGEFYDILFVDASGLVFHSIRYESDLGTNLLTGPLAHSRLAKALPAARTTVFVDYEVYRPSEEPAAFFVVPVFQDDVLEASARPPSGWFVLQCPLNRVTSILADRRGLGRTGETYLVNAERRMLTESRFQPDAEELQIRVDSQATANALNQRAGDEIITDYRGVRVLSSYEAFDVFGSTWVVIAEIDEDEVISERFKLHEAENLASFVQTLQRRKTIPRLPPAANLPTSRVDMNEFRKTTGGTVLRTAGVATCTAVAAALPGRFGYLAHIGPTDVLYRTPDRGHNDRLGDMLARLYRYDIHPYQVSELQFTIIATHQFSLRATVDKLLDLGAELSQIRFAYNPAAQHANVTLASAGGIVTIEWVAADGFVTTILANDIESLGSLMKQMGNGTSADRETKREE